MILGASLLDFGRRVEVEVVDHVFLWAGVEGLPLEHHKEEVGIPCLRIAGKKYIRNAIGRIVPERARVICRR